MSERKKYVSIVSIVEKYGKDLSKVDLSIYMVDVSGCDMSDIKLPKDRNLFNYFVCAIEVLIPFIDFNEYDFTGVDIGRFKFHEKSIFSKDKDFFQKIKEKSFRRAELPEWDYSGYNFDGVILQGAKFAKDSVLPGDKELFQKICNKNILGTVMPEGDYREYNFEGVNCYGVKFSFDSLLPEDSNFLQLIQNVVGNTYWEDYIIGTDDFRLTRNVVENIHNYDLNGVIIDLRDYEEYLTETQLSLIRIKYKEELNESICLPERGLFKEKYCNREKTFSNELTV